MGGCCDRCGVTGANPPGEILCTACKPPKRLGVTVCEECGSTRVQYLEWIWPNKTTGDVVAGGNDTTSEGDHWCERCDDNTLQEWIEGEDLPANPGGRTLGSLIREGARRKRKAQRGAYQAHAWKP